MGLSGRKVKQRIGNDPRNLAWADDAAKFGQTYLSKFGWDASRGLGVNGEGRLSHVKVSQKLDMFGIGAAQQKDPNGIAWKQNKDFEQVLERLNVAATEDTFSESKAMDAEGAEGKKRKREDGGETAAKRSKSDPVAGAVAAVEAVKPVVPRHRASVVISSFHFYLTHLNRHRARAIAAKNLASKSAAAISEILGIAATPSAETTTTTTPQGSLTPYDDGVELEKLQTSKQSVADYFKDKLLTKAGKSGSVTCTPPAEVDDRDAPRGGLGSSRVALKVKTDEAVDARMGLGLSKLSSMMAAAFSAASTSVAVSEETQVEVSKVKAEKKVRKLSEDEEVVEGTKKTKTKKRISSEDIVVVEEVKADKKKKSSKQDEAKKKKRNSLEEQNNVADNMGRSLEEDTAKRKDKKGKRLQDVGEEAAKSVSIKTKKQRRGDKGKGETEVASDDDAVNEEERKRAKREKKR
ncbi:hypothetical protein GGX14DRAFT_452525 [Mycena pura]|uniref:G-patch domain-containing protein n=1 Tax=Mycena pura TaxID=153505 RepID=A0AAD6YA56_9AGAR|nr:hypothetical protein GGX14DRAFT_452525 [Mycena pura]